MKKVIKGVLNGLILFLIIPLVVSCISLSHGELVLIGRELVIAGFLVLALWGALIGSECYLRIKQLEEKRKAWTQEHGSSAPVKGGSFNIGYASFPVSYDINPNPWNIEGNKAV